MLCTLSRVACPVGTKRALGQTMTFANDAGSLVETPLNEWHLQYGGKMVPFAGYSLPVLYENLPKGAKGGVSAEHHHTRDAGKSSIFDVSHMGQIIWTGKDRVKFIEKVVCSDIQSLAPGEGLLSLITNETGGIIDDSVISNSTDGESIYMVVNGANKFIGMDHFNKVLADFDGDVTMNYLEVSEEKWPPNQIKSKKPLFFPLSTNAGFHGSSCSSRGRCCHSSGFPPSSFDQP